MTLPSHKLSLNVGTDNKLFPAGLWKEPGAGAVGRKHLKQPPGAAQVTAGAPTSSGVRRGAGMFSHLCGGGGGGDSNPLDEGQSAVFR